MKIRDKEINEKCEELYISHREDQEIKIGDIVSETTSEFTWNGVDHCFDKEANEYTGCIVREFWFDDSEFNEDKCNNGGCYGYYYHVVVEVLE